MPKGEVFCSKVLYYIRKLRFNLSTITNLKIGTPEIFSVLYFFGCNFFVSFFSIQNNPKNLEPSHKMDLDLWDCLGWVKICIKAIFQRTDLVTVII